MGRPSRFTADDIRVIAAMRRQGKSWRAIGIRLGRPFRRIRGMDHTVFSNLILGTVQSLNRRLTEIGLFMPKAGRAAVGEVVNMCCSDEQARKRSVAADQAVISTGRGGADKSRSGLTG